MTLDVELANFDLRRGRYLNTADDSVSDDLVCFKPIGSRGGILFAFFPGRGSYFVASRYCADDGHFACSQEY